MLLCILSVYDGYFNPAEDCKTVIPDALIHEVSRWTNCLVPYLDIWGSVLLCTEPSQLTVCSYGDPGGHEPTACVRLRGPACNIVTRL